MKTFSKDINIYCDLPITNDNEACWCWGESSVTLNWWEGKMKAFKMFKNAGWILGKKEDICPYHAKGIKKP